MNTDRSGIFDNEYCEPGDLRTYEILVEWKQAGYGGIPRSLTKISPVAVTSLCWLTNAFRSFKILFLTSKRPRRLGSIPPASLESFLFNILGQWSSL